MRNNLLITLLILISSLTSPLFAADEVSNLKLEERTSQLNDIRDNLDTINAKRKELQKTIEKITDPDEKLEEQQHLDQLNAQRKDFQALFEQIALGGLDTSRFALPTKTAETESVQNYNWQQELVKILQPVFNEMQRMTANARKKDDLLEEQQNLSDLIMLAEQGLRHLNDLPAEQLNPEALTNLKTLQQNWNERLNTLNNQKELVDSKLHVLTGDTPFLTKLKNNLIGFMKGRGLTLFTAIMVSLILYYTLSAVATLLINRYEERRKRVISFKWRLVLLTYQLVIGILSLIAFMVILHSFGDMVLFGVAVLILLALLISLRKVIPNYLMKLRIFLNLGKARESERVIYNGIPWEIEHIHLYSVFLNNPALDNGQIRISIDMLEGLVSRPLKTDELWFPTRPNDTIILPDKRMATVLRQTPEAVYLRSDGATLIYPTAEFFSLKFKNLTQGYTIVATVTIDPLPDKNGGDADSTRALPTVQTIAERLQKVLLEEIKALTNECSDSIRHLNVTLKQMSGAHNGTYRIALTVLQNSAKYYHDLINVTQIALANLAEKEHWKISVTEIGSGN